MATLQVDDRLVETTDDRSWRVVRRIGCGAQGCVYEVDGADGPMAVKWFVDAWASTTHRDAIERLITGESPSPSFVWPEAMVECVDRPGFGYVMRLIERPPLVEMTDVMSRRTIPTHTALVTSALTISRAIASLHSRGLSYRDLSHANVMLDPVVGRTAVFDVDNVVPVDSASTTSVIGTPGYLAPETITSGAQVGQASDLHALAVLVFLLLVNHHPLRGCREFDYPVLDSLALNELYGAKARFIFDRSRDDNRPDPNEHPNAISYWAILPEYLRDRFGQAFETGLWNPARRVTAAEWVDTLQRLHDGIYVCPDCGAEIYDDPRIDGPPLCWGCGAPRPERLVLDTGRARIALHVGRTIPGPTLPCKTIEERHLAATGAGEPRIVATVVPHHEDPTALMLHNASSGHWTVGTTLGSRTATVPRGHRITLRPDYWLDFGKGIRATIHSPKPTN
jgi:DNA-binding helix-hairpin-helix protein with protein kinase domain